MPRAWEPLLQVPGSGTVRVSLPQVQAGKAAEQESLLQVPQEQREQESQLQAWEPLPQVQQASPEREQVRRELPAGDLPKARKSLPGALLQAREPEPSSHRRRGGEE